MSIQDHIKQLIALHQRNLNVLELQKAASGPIVPMHLLNAIDLEKSAIAKYQGELEEINSGNVRNVPEEIAEDYRGAKGKFYDFRQKLNFLSTELDELPNPVKVEATFLINYAQGQLSSLENEWDKLNTGIEISKDDLKVFMQKVSISETSLSILERRRIYRKNMTRLREQLKSQQMVLLPDQLQKIVTPQIIEEEKAIHTLQERNQISHAENALLESHQENLKLYKEMLAGIRSYAPVVLFRQIAEIERNIKEIDLELEAGSNSKKIKSAKQDK